jgi:hypothetical protein
VQAFGVAQVAAREGGPAPRQRRDVVFGSVVVIVVRAQPPVRHHVAPAGGQVRRHCAERLGRARKAEAVEDRADVVRRVPHDEDAARLWQRAEERTGSGRERVFLDDGVAEVVARFVLNEGAHFGSVEARHASLAALRRMHVGGQPQVAAGRQQMRDGRRAGFLVPQHQHGSNPRRLQRRCEAPVQPRPVRLRCREQLAQLRFGIVQCVFHPADPHMAG